MSEQPHHLTEREFIGGILPRVSRTFALGIEGLHEPLRHDIGVAYVLCRLLDTLEDTAAIPAAQRSALLLACAEGLERPERLRDVAYDIRDKFRAMHAHVKEAEFALCMRADTVFGEFERLPLREVMAPHVHEMACGMAEVTRREAEQGAVLIQDFEGLERYCYYVAGTVGKLLSRAFAASRESMGDSFVARLAGRDVAFGLGLQLVNVIKGMGEDHGRGVVFVPQELLMHYRCTMAELVEQPSSPAAHQVVGALVKRARAALDAAIEYIVLIPASERDIRLFCVLPHFFALRTCALALETPLAFSPTQELKISRQDVAEIRSWAEERALACDEELQRAHAEGCARIAASM